MEDNGRTSLRLLYLTLTKVLANNGIITQQVVLVNINKN